MKYMYRYSLLGIAGLLLFYSKTVWTQTEVIHCWDFNNGSNNNTWPSPIATTARIIGNGSITHNFNSNPEACGGSTINSCEGSAAGTAFCPKGRNENKQSFTLLFSTQGYEDLVLSFWCLRSSPGNSDKGFNNNTIAYSTDGGSNWSDYGTFSPEQNGNLESVNFSSIPACNDNEDFQIRITLDGADNPNGGNSYDNIKMEGTPIPLPLDLLSFTVNQQSNNVVLAWTFDNARHFDRFEVEHMTNQREWQSIGAVVYDELPENTRATHHIHEHPPSGLNYYRLRMVDRDGSEELSRIQSVNIQNTDGVSPVNTIVDGPLIIERRGPGANSQLIILDLQGRLLHSSLLPAAAMSMSIDMSRFSKGVYLLQAVTQGEVEVFKVFKM